MVVVLSGLPVALTVVLAVTEFAIAGPNTHQ